MHPSEIARWIDRLQELAEAWTVRHPGRLAGAGLVTLTVARVTSGGSTADELVYRGDRDAARVRLDAQQASLLSHLVSQLARIEISELCDRDRFHAARYVLPAFAAILDGRHLLKVREDVARRFREDRDAIRWSCCGPAEPTESALSAAIAAWLASPWRTPAGDCWMAGPLRIHDDPRADLVHAQAEFLSSVDEPWLRERRRDALKRDYVDSDGPLVLVKVRGRLVVVVDRRLRPWPADER